jgi:hypothetical protein
MEKGIAIKRTSMSEHEIKSEKRNKPETATPKGARKAGTKAKPARRGSAQEAAR